MTQKRQQSKKMTEFNSLFLSLDEKTQDQTLLMLKTLEFAQSVSAPETKSETAAEKQQSGANCTVI